MPTHYLIKQKYLSKPIWNPEHIPMSLEEFNQIAYRKDREMVDKEEKEKIMSLAGLKDQSRKYSLDKLREIQTKITTSLDEPKPIPEPTKEDIADAVWNDPYDPYTLTCSGSIGLGATIPPSSIHGWDVQPNKLESHGIFIHGNETDQLPHIRKLEREQEQSDAAKKEMKDEQWMNKWDNWRNRIDNEREYETGKLPVEYPTRREPENTPAEIIGKVIHEKSKELFTRLRSTDLTPILAPIKRLPNQITKALTAVKKGIVKWITIPE